MTDADYQFERQKLDVIEQELKLSEATQLLTEGKRRAESEAREKILKLQADVEREKLRLAREHLLLKRKEFVKDNPFQAAEQ